MQLLKLKKLLYRNTPITTLHWRFFLANQSDSIKLHRYAFFQQNKKFGLPTRFLIFLFSQIKWWLISAPIQIFKLSKKQHNPTIQSLSDFLKDLPQLFRLSYCYNIPPALFYSFPLKEVSAEHWLDYVYDFQCITWHSAFLDSSLDLKLIDNKKTFAEYLKHFNIPVIDAIHSIDQDEKLSSVIEKIKTSPESFFCKPISSNQSKGCYRVSNNIGDQQLTVFFKFNYRTLSQVNRKWLAFQISRQPYLIQPLLENPNSLKAINDCELLVFRVVTFTKAKTINIELAQTEIKISLNNKNYLFSLQINPTTGSFVNCLRSDDAELSRVIEQLQIWLTTNWPTISSTAVQAHKRFVNHFSIGWDIAITENGAVVIEGNHFWATELHQSLLETPLLKTNCCSYYLSAIT